MEVIGPEVLQNIKHRALWIPSLTLAQRLALISLISEHQEVEEEAGVCSAYFKTVC